MSQLEMHFDGNVLKVFEQPGYVSIYGRINYLVLYNPACDTDAIVKFGNFVGYLRLFGDNLEILEKDYDHLKLKGKLNQIEIQDKNGKLIGVYTVDPCVIKVTKKRMHRIEDEKVEVEEE